MKLQKETTILIATNDGDVCEFVISAIIIDTVSQNIVMYGDVTADFKKERFIDSSEKVAYGVGINIIENKIKIMKLQKETTILIATEDGDVCEFVISSIRIDIRSQRIAIFGDVTEDFTKERLIDSSKEVYGVGINLLEKKKE